MRKAPAAITATGAPLPGEARLIARKRIPQMSTITAYETKAGKRWRAVYRKPDGSQTSRRGFLRKRDAEEWLAEHVTVAKASGSFVDPAAGRRKVGDLWPAWIAKKRLSSKASYVESLERAWRVHVAPRWAARTIGSLSRSEIQEWVGAQAAGKSATVVIRNLGILRGICNDAVADRLIQANPCDGVETPRKRRRKRTYLTAGQLFRLASESGGRGTLVLVLGLCGLRWGEMAGLHVADVDFRRHRLSVVRSATMVGDCVVVDVPKSGKGRQVVFPAILDAPLRAQCAGRDGGEPLFPAAGGGYLARIAPNDRTKWFWWAKRRAGVPLDLTFHDLRHTAASLMVSSGANVKAVQNQLGHASAAMTLDVYADLFDDDLDGVGRAMDALLRREDVAKLLPQPTVSAS